jgi:hypothetical protein
MYIEIVFCKGFLAVIGNQCSRKLRRKQSDMTKKEIFCSNSIRWNEFRVSHEKRVATRVA